MAENYSVYMHTCPNGKRYVGITSVGVEERWNAGRGYKKQVFGRAVSKYKWHNICHEVLLTKLSKSEAVHWERFFIAMFRTEDLRYGYNCDSGGSLGKTVSDETRKKLSFVARKPWKNEDFREKMSALRKGRYHTPEAKKKISKSHIGHSVSEETREKLSKSLKGRVPSMKGKHHTLETKIKISESHKGDKHYRYGREIPDETRRKISASLKGRSRPDDIVSKIKETKRAACGVSVVNLDTSEVFESMTEAAEKYALSKSNLCAVLKGRRKTCGGYRWSFYTEEK